MSQARRAAQLYLLFLALKESSFNMRAKGGRNYNGTYDHGLFQINELTYHGRDIYDAEGQMRGLKLVIGYAFSWAKKRARNARDVVRTVAGGHRVGAGNMAPWAGQENPLGKERADMLEAYMAKLSISHEDMLEGMQLIHSGSLKFVQLGNKTLPLIS